MNLKRSFIAALLIVGLYTTGAQAQASLNSSTLSAAISSASATSVTVASATGAVAGSTSLVVDQEVMDIVAVSGTRLTVTRGMAGTRAATHASGAVTKIAARPFVDSVGRSGSCTATNERVLPILVPTEGKSYDCVGSRWVGSPLISSFGAVGDPILSSCGATSGNANCANTRGSGNAFIVSGVATLSAGKAIISAISPTFTSTATGACTANDTSGASGVLTEVEISGVSSLTISGTGAGTVAWLCVGY
jgi:hypothetical protein